jgi:hypothetical protein
MPSGIESGYDFQDIPDLLESIRMLSSPVLKRSMVEEP